MTINDKLKNQRLKLGLTMLQLSKKVGVSEATISRWESGDIANMKRDKIVALAKALNVTPSFVMGWDSEPNAPAPESLSAPGIPDLPEVRPVKVKTIPLFAEIACGEPILANEDIKCYVPVDDDIDADFCVIANGDSMTGARINDGDIVFIQSAAVINDGDIAAVWIAGDGATLKRVYRQNNTLSLIAENSKYAPLVYTEERNNEVRLLGKAIAFQSNL